MAKVSDRQSTGVERGARPVLVLSWIFQDSRSMQVN
jgi:hypothetical protein